jgi:EmrB/QacA subfamily drug resistance transporter
LTETDTHQIPSIPERPEDGPKAACTPLSQRSVIAIFVALLVAMVAAALDQTVIATALPTIVGDLDGANHMLWVTTAYVLASTVTMPAYGKMGDLIGRKGLFIGALMLFIVGSVICALAPAMPELIAGRAIQGLGGGGLMILSQAIVADVVPPRKRAWYLSVMSIAYAVPTLAGPLLGGFFTDTVGWRWAFWVNVPLALLAIAVAFVCLPASKRTYRAGSFDLWGTVTLTLALSALTFATSLGGTALDWDSPIIIGLLAGAALMVLLFVKAETHAKQPVMALYLFKNRNFIVCAVGGFITMFVMMGVLTYLPTYFQIVDQMSATEAGYMELPMNIAWFLASLASGALVARSGRYKKLMVASFAILVVGVAALCGVTTETPGLAIGLLLAVTGFGIGLNFEVLVLIVQNEFSDADVGMSTAATNLGREMGTTLGTSVVGALFTSRLAATLSAGMASLGGSETLGVDANALTPAIVRELPETVKSAVQTAYNDALIPVFWLMAALAVAGLISMLLLREKHLR